MALEVRVVTPEKEVWRGDASLVIARGVEGEVGILAGHAPMLIRLAISVLRIQQEAQETKMAVDGGFLHVTSGDDGTRVDVLASHADRAEDLDVDALRTRAEDLRGAAREGDEEAEQELKKAEARLSLAG